MRTLTSAIVGLAILTCGPFAQIPASPEALLKAAQQREQVDGDDTGALAAYTVITKQFPSHAAAARAWLQIGRIHERRDDVDRAREAYSQAAANRQDAMSAANARARLKELSGPALTLSKRKLTEPTGVGEYGRLSPDAGWLAYNDSWVKIGSGNLGTWNLATGRTALLTGEPCCDWTNGYAESSAWSADGTKLVLAWRKARETDLRVVSRTGPPVGVLMDTAAVRGIAELEVAPNPGRAIQSAWIEPFAWSPDGRFIVAGVSKFVGPGVSEQPRLIRVSVADGSAIVLKTLGPRNLPGNASYSRDGKYIAYDYRPTDDVPGRDIFVMSADGTAAVQVVADPSSDDLLMGWMPDGKHLVYASDRLGRRDAWAMPVASGAASGPPFLVTRDIGDVTPRGISADGRMVVEVRLNQSDVYVTTLDSGAARFRDTPQPLARVQAGVARSQATWSPSADRIAYFQGGAGRPHAMVVQDVKTGAHRVYPLKVRNSERPVWQPDGRAVAFNAVGDQDSQAVFTIDLVTEAVTRTATGNQVAFSPDGRYLYYQRPQTVVRRQLTDGLEEVVARVVGVAGALKLSPDGSRFATFQGQTRGVVTFPASGGEPRVLAEGMDRAQNHLAWTPDGKHVLFVVDARQVWRVSAEGGKPEKVGELSERAGVIKHLSVSAEGRLAMSVVGYESELWMWNNLPALVRSRAGRE